MTVREPGRLERGLAGSLVRSLLYRRRPMSPHVPPGDALLPRIRFNASDGATLVGIHHPANAPQGIVVLVHPDKRLAKHWWRRRGIIDWLNAHRLEAFTFDLSVYGESRGGNVYLHEHVIAAVEEAARHRPDLPIHLWGVSIGSFAAINAAPALPGLTSLVAESPYPSFRAWYTETGRRGGAWIIRLLERVFPATYTRIDAAQNIARIHTPRILIAATRSDATTPVALSRAVADAAPKHTRYIEYDDAAHLALFDAVAAYRTTLLETFSARPASDDAPDPLVTDPLLTPGVTSLSPLGT